MAHPRSPLAPDHFPALLPIAGVSLAVGRQGFRYKDRDDLLLATLAPGSTVAGVLTTSRTFSAPVAWCRRALQGGRARAIVVNAGNANAFTARAGDLTVEATVNAAAALLDCTREEVFVASTGVIGEPLAPDAIAAKLPSLADALTEDAWAAAAAAIMTTDTFPKGSTAGAAIDGVPVRINGFAKGSGMIHPNMATMLAFAFTDAGITAPALQALLSEINERTFNSITVDGDTSTSDTLLLAATGRAGHALVSDPSDPRLSGFRAALETVLRDLAQQVVRDGEGASKFVSITVTGAESDADAKAVGLSIGNSPLVKTAFAGGDANWGRIVMAAGKAGVPVERDLLSISMGGIPITVKGGLRPDYDEAPVAEHLRRQEVSVQVDLGLGTGEWTVWTCDLTHGYIDINGSYRS